MCVLCNADNLRLLVAPEDSLSHLDLAESIRVAREAAMQYVMDAVDALREAPLETVPRLAGPEAYREYVVERAEEAGVAARTKPGRWGRAPAIDLADPRVQAFLSSAAEGMAAYLARIAEHQGVISRYLEVQPGTVVFGGVGPFAEIRFRQGGEEYVVLSHEEALQIAIDRVAEGLSREDPALLLRYTTLPDGAVDILAEAQRRPEEEANQVLAGMVDVGLLAEDLLRQTGYGWVVVEDPSVEFDEQRFGEFVIIRLLGSAPPFEEA